MKVEGRWRKLTETPCAARYPAEIEFEQTTYLGRKGPDQGFIVWDAGIYSLDHQGRITIGTATDELVPYELSLVGDILSFVDSGGCEFSYKRVE